MVLSTRMTFTKWRVSCVAGVQCRSRCPASLAGMVAGMDHRLVLLSPRRLFPLPLPPLPLTPVITDPEDPKFDLEKVFASWEKA